MNSDHVATIREALEAARFIAQKDIRLYISLGNQVTPGEISILEKAKVRLVRIDAALAALDEAAGWEVVPDGEVSSFMYVDNGGKLLGVYAGDDYTDWYATEDLPDHIRLCRKRPPAQG